MSNRGLNDLPSHFWKHTPNFRTDQTLKPLNFERPTNCHLYFRCMNITYLDASDGDPHATDGEQCDKQDDSCDDRRGDGDVLPGLQIGLGRGDGCGEAGKGTLWGQRD